MNAATRNKFIDRFRGSLPEFFYTNVPVPSFMETPITFDTFFKQKSQRANSKQTVKAGTAATVLEGRIETGKECKYSINEKDLEIDNGTWIVGNIELGITARAKGRMQGQKFYVSQLILLKK